MRALVLTFAAVAVAGLAWAAIAGAGGPEQLPPNWHVHDCNNPAVDNEPACGFDASGDWHLGVGFFPAILGISPAEYARDPARCPNATDKAFLPQGQQDSQPLRSGVCQTSTKVIHLRTVTDGTGGPEGWGFRDGPEPGYDTYYLITSR